MSNIKFRWISVLSLFFLSCSNQNVGKPNPVVTGSVCSQNFLDSYHAIVQADNSGHSIEAMCTEFGKQYQDIKCLAIADNIELRFHSDDILLRCKLSSSQNSEKTNQSPSLNIPSSVGDWCNTAFYSYIENTEKLFKYHHQAIASKKTISEENITKTLKYKRLCNQFFNAFKYKKCTQEAGDKSFLSIKPYCDYFQKVIHQRKINNSENFYPFELRPLEELSLKFRFRDQELFFNKPEVKNKLYISRGQVVKFSDIVTSDTFCYLESSRIKSAHELGREIYSVDFQRFSSSKISFSYNAFDEQFRLVCSHTKPIYLQEIVESLGDLIDVYR